MVTRARAWAAGAATARTVRPSAAARRGRILDGILPHSAGQRIGWSRSHLWDCRPGVRRRRVGGAVGRRNTGVRGTVGRQPVRRKAEAVMSGRAVRKLGATGRRPAVLA